MEARERDVPSASGASATHGVLRTLTETRRYESPGGGRIAAGASGSFGSAADPNRRRGLREPHPQENHMLD
jgi:hypothetical protein